MVSTQDRLNAILPSWYELLTQWSQDGTLAAAATDALNLESSNAKKNAKGQLQSLVSQWSAGNFKSLPEIVLLSNEDISGAQGAYAESTGKIYLNADWLLTASEEDINKVLTEELGHYLDNQLNFVDTKDDEGEAISYILYNQAATFSPNGENATAPDFIQINTGKSIIDAEASSSLYQSPSFGTTPSENATYWSNETNTQFTGTINGSSNDDVYTGIPYAIDPLHATIYGLTINDTSGNTFISATSYNWNAGPNGAINLSNFNLGDGYIKIDSAISNGNYNYAFTENIVNMGSGDSDINVSITGSTVYYNQVAFDADVNAGGGNDVINVTVSTTKGSVTYVNGIIGSNLDMGDGNDIVSSKVSRYISSTYYADAITDTTVSMGSGSDKLIAHSTQTALRNSLFDLGIDNDYAEISGDSYQSLIDFGEGDDQLRLFGTAAEYSFSQAGSEWKITKYSNPEYSLSVQNLEEVIFDDQTLNLTPKQTSFFVGNSLYVVVNGDWDTSEQASIELGGNLVTVNNSDEQQWLYSTFKDVYSQLWIGLNDRQVEGQMVWTSGQDLTFTDWILNEPSNGFGFDGRGEDVTQIQLGVTSGPTWNDVYGDLTDGIGLAEIPVVLSITADTPISERAGLSTITIDLFAGSESTGNLLNGQTIYWSISGISQEDLEMGALTGSGAVVDGKAQIQYDLADDNILEDENLVVKVYSDAEMQYQIGDAYSSSIVDSTPVSVIGTATSDASPIVISGNLTAPLVESYATTTSGRGKNKTTVGAFTEVMIDKSGPLDALVVNGGESNNTITGNGFADNTSTEINEARSAFSGVLVIDGKGGADTITGGTSGTNWLIGGGVTNEGTVDTLTGVALATEIFDLRREVGDVWEDAYSVGNAAINSYDLGDYIVLAKDQSQYQVSNQTQTIERVNKRGKVIGEDTVTYFEIKDISGDLIATVNGSGFTSSSSAADLKIVYGQNSQDPFEVVLPSATPGTII